MIIAVTGCAGFIGFHVAQALLEKGDTVVGIDNLSPYYDVSLKESRFKLLKENNHFLFHNVDISNFEALHAVFQKHTVECICHLAAQAGVRYSLEHPFVYESANNLGTLNLLEMSRKKGINRFVFASSSSVYGGNKKVPFSEVDRVDSPISLYAATKRYNELLAYTYHHLYDIQCTGLRFFTVYGPWGRPDMALFKFTKNILEGKSIELFNYGKMKRDFTYIGDIVPAVLAAIDKKLGYEIINLGGNRPVELTHFVSCIEKATGKKAERCLLPLQQGDVLETFADIAKAKELLGFSPHTTIEEGVAAFVAWYMKYYKVSGDGTTIGKEV